MKIPDTTATENRLKDSPYDIYFLSNLYDDDVIMETIKEFNHFYNTDLHGEDVAQNNAVQCGSISDIIVDNELNYKYGIDPNSHALRIPLRAVPWHSEVDFIDEFGYGTPIHAIDILANGTIFSKSLFLFIGEYFLYDIRYVIEKDYLIAFITKGNHLQEEAIHQLIESADKWRLLSSTKGSIYQAYSHRNVLITNGNRIYISNLTRLSVQKNHADRETGWTLYMGDSVTSPSIMTSTHVMLKEDAAGAYFEIPEKYKNFVYQRLGTMKVLITNEPDCTGSGIYMGKEGQSPIFQLPYKRVPIPVNNLLIWEYDIETNRKKYPIIPKVSVIYPNIYDFSEVEFENGIYIEWIESDGIPRKLDLIFQDYIDFCGNSYPQKLLSSEVPNVVKTYEPASPSPFEEEKYLESSLFGDYRGWKVKQMVYLLKDNPIRYRFLFSHLYRKSMRYMSSTYTPETYPDIYTRSITNNATHCDGDDDHATVFAKPQAYIKVNNLSCRYRHCSLFFNGIRKIPTYIMTYGGYMYVYFPAEWIANGEMIQLDTGLINDIVPTDDNTFKFLYTTSEHRCSNDVFSRKHSLSDILFYDGKTKEFLTNSFDVNLAISIYDIKYKNKELIDEISFLDTDAELMVQKQTPGDPLIFASKGVEYFITKRKTLDWKIGDLTRNSHKDIDLRNVVLKNPEEDIVGKPIHMATTDFYATYVYNFTQTGESFGLIEYWESGHADNEGVYDTSPVYTPQNEILIVNGTTLTIKNYRGAHSKGHFRIFVDGKLQNPNVFNVEFPTTYGGDCLINTTDMPVGYTVVDYMPYEESILYNGKISALKKSGDAILYLHDYLKGCSFDPMIYRVYIDGIRIPEDDISVLGSGTSILIRQRGVIKDSSTAVILYQAMDEELNPFDYNKNSVEYMMYDSALLQGSQEYRNWVINKYK